MTYMPAAYRPALGATDVPTPTPSKGSPQPPIWPLRVGNNGGYLFVRQSPANGSCGVSSYPCKHPGVDVAGSRGTTVVAPENGIVVDAADGSGAPYSGYGPWLVIIRGASGRFHMLAHLDPSTRNDAPIGLPVVAGQRVGTVSSANHTHWELRKKKVPDFARGETNFTNNLDPIAWLRSGGGTLTAILLGGASALLLVFLYWRTR